MEHGAMTETLTRLAHQFQRFGERECLPASPLYARLAVGIAGDEQLLRLAAAAQARPVPNLFFGAVQYLLLTGVRDPLAAFYPALSDAPLDIHQHDPFAVFRAFCLAHAEAMSALLKTRRVQTNEVRRCACLLPAFTLVHQYGGERPLALVEVGASAGLNLLWDRYHYDYGEQSCGDRASPVQLHCALRGPARPALPQHMPDIAIRIGLDLHPIDVHDEAEALWLRALIWPEQRERVVYFQQAIGLAQAESLQLRAGDAITLLPDVMAQAPPWATLCLYHTFVLNQFPQAAREQFRQLLDVFGASRDFSVIGIEWQEPVPPLTLTTYRNGARSEQTLATCDPHGAWLEWA
jgi:hypothetical protein